LIKETRQDVKGYLLSKRVWNLTAKSRMLRRMPNIM
jgi:hypothetical protein